MLTYLARNQLPDDYVGQMEGKFVSEKDISLLVNGPTRIEKPNGDPLLVYVPKAISPELREQAYPTLHTLKNAYTNNRGMAAGGTRVKGPSNRSYARAVASPTIGYSDPQGQRRWCRITAWSGKETEKWLGLFPLFKRIATIMEEHVPERYANQARIAARTSPDWVIEGTPFTTITVNNTYSTAVHKDDGDLDEGFSTLVVFREGDFKGGWLCLPAYRIAVDMQDSDLLLMDAHEFHGNTPLDPEPVRKPNGILAEDPGFERISVVSYFRTAMAECGSAADENERMMRYNENRAAASVGE
jgi:hypothetical protein